MQEEVHPIYLMAGIVPYREISPAETSSSFLVNLQSATAPFAARRSLGARGAHLRREIVLAIKDLFLVNKLSAFVRTQYLSGSVGELRDYIPADVPNFTHQESSTWRFFRVH